jgi:Ca-activated chloride channel family protein
VAWLHFFAAIGSGLGLSAPVVSLSFAQPIVLLLLLSLPALAVLKWWSNYRARVRTRKLVAARLIPSLVTGHRPALAGALFALELVAIACLIVALARPRYGFREKEVEGEGRSIMIAVDTSRSMLAEDLAPNRLQRALLAARDLVLAIPNDRIGVIAFAGRAFVQAPLTIDHSAVLETLDQLDTSIIPRGGTNLSEAIDRAIETFDKVESANHALIIFTDGDELEGDALIAARKASENNVMIITIGVGTRAGGFIPDPRKRGSKGYVVNAQGNVVRTRLDGERLEQLARATRGLYLRLDSGEMAGALVKKALENLDKVTLTSQRTTREPIERFRWPLTFGVGLLLISWVGMLGMVRFSRFSGAAKAARGAVNLLPCIFFLAVGSAWSPAEAGIFDRNPYAALSSGEHAAAIELLSRRLEQAPQSRFAQEWTFARGTAAFRAGDFDLAIQDFGQALLSDDRRLQEQSHYNLANAIASKVGLRTDEEELDEMIQDISDAIEHYGAALNLNDSNVDAAENRKTLVEYLEQLEQAREETAGDEGESQESNQGEGSDSGENGEPGEGEPSPSSDGKGKGEGKDGQSPGEGTGEGDSEGEGNGQESDEQSGGESKEETDNEDGESGDDSELEGDLKAEPQNGEQAKQPNGKKAGGRGKDKKDPRTGFSPSEARQLLRALADEDRKIRPIYGKPKKEGDYEDW